MTLFHFKPVLFERKEKAIQKSFKPASTRKQVQKYVETVMFLPRTRFIRMTCDCYGVLLGPKILQVLVQVFEIILKQSMTRGLWTLVSIFIMTQNTWM